MPSPDDLPAHPSFPGDAGNHGGLPITGERTVPDVPDENYWFQRHVVAYRHVGARTSGTVVDAGCGEGYGLALLRGAGARGVIGIDHDPLVVAHARRRYGSDRIEVVEADLADMPLVDDTVNLVACLQVVEHLRDAAACLAEMLRICQPGGLVAVSTPNRATFSPDRDGPANPFHVREYDAGELVELLDAAGATVTEVLGVRHTNRLQAALDREAGNDPTAVLADPTRWSPGLRTIVHAVTADDFVITPDDVESSLDLVAWARAPG